MNEFRLHSNGPNDHLNALKKKYNVLKEKIKRNQKLTEAEKNVELKTLIEFFKKESKTIKNNNY